MYCHLRQARGTKDLFLLFKLQQSDCNTKNDCIYYSFMPMFFKQWKYFFYICWIFNNERVRQTHYAIVKADQFGNFDNCSAISLANRVYYVYVHVKQELLLKVSDL